MSDVIAGIQVPQTTAAAEATRLVRETTSPLSYHRSRRVFFSSEIHAQRLGEFLGVHPRGDFENEFLRTYFEGQEDRPETTNGTVNADALEHFMPDLRRTTTVERILGSAWPS